MSQNAVGSTETNDDLPSPDNREPQRSAPRNSDKRRASEWRKVGINMPYRLVSIMAWICLLFIAWATLSPVTLRPRLLETDPAAIVIVEHVGAFAVIGFLFSAAYSRTALIFLLVLGSAVILELLQLVVPDRDARIVDAIEKLIGGGAGIFAAKIICSYKLANSEPGMPGSNKKSEHSLAQQ